MKKELTIMLTYLFISAYGFAATEFNMSFSTVQPGGTYNPKNVLAVWVTQTNGAFVKTIYRRALDRKSSLSTWIAAGGSTENGTTIGVDGYMGATRMNHSDPAVNLTASWDLKNKSGIIVPDGTYKINFEMTDGSRVIHSFNFVKNGIAGTRTDPGTAYFKNISIAYAPPGSANTAPVAKAQSVTTAEDTAKAITLTATDAETNALNYAIVTGPAHGTLSGTAPNVTYTPAANFYGADSFTFRASDASLTSTPATVSITVTAVNDAPVAQVQSVSTSEDTAKAITLAATDVETNALIYAIVNGPTNGTLSGAAPNVTYTPATNYYGTDSFTFRASDASLTSAPATVSITVAQKAAYYVLTVSGGSGSGSYTNGQKVTIAATVPVGSKFDRWTGSTQYLASVTSSSTTVTMPATAVVFSASLKDMQIPVLTISSPLTGVRLTNAAVTVTGKATDNSGAADVLIRLNSGDWTTNNVLLGTTNWTVGLTLIPGTNTIRACARDAAGNSSLTTSVVCTYVVYGTLTIQTNGPGTVTRLPIGIPEVGKSYTLTAVPAKIGSAFSNWTGDAAGTNKAVSFIMTSNMTIAANFTDTLKPTVAITAPTAALRILGTNGLFTVRGTATDNLSLSNVLVQLNGGSWTDTATTNSYKNWSLPVMLTTGTNVIRACSIDTTGNYSLTSSVTCIYVVTGTLNIQTNGPGTVTRLPIGIPEVGKRYTLTAVPPKAGGVFASWTGDASGTNKVVTFIMTSNMTFTANFTDTLKPTVAITYPTALLRVVTNRAVIIRGTAADNGGLGGVKYQLPTGEWTNAVTTNVWKNWTAEYSPVSGLNTARVYSVDLQGNVSSTSAVVFTYAPGAVMQVQTNGAGTITPAYNGQVLEIGKSYIMTAKAASGFVFTNWTYGISGLVATNKAAVTFVMQSNLVLTANFQSLLAPPVALAAAMAVPATLQAAIAADGLVDDWANVPSSSFSYASVTQEVAVALDGNNIALLLNGCPFGTSDTVLVYFKLRLSYGSGDTRHTVDLWTSGSVLYGMVDGQAVTGLESVLLNGVLEVKLPVEQAPSQVTIEEVGCGMNLGGGTLTELFKLILP